ncbi:energy transducer TonB [Ramlibacter sp.]|uniref:energy transducer TonB n=1 Tax=Ramlibacter sp. TaxID=1917967 RepID=UPI00261EC6CA|nr:energy transducer TonB [Ramlibacter sp.]
MSPSPRNALIAAGVVLLHLAALWALQSGLLQRVVEVVVPVEVLGAITTPPPPVPAPPAPPPPKPVERPIARPVERNPLPAPAPAPAPRPVARPDPAPAAPSAPTAVSEPQPAPPPISAPVAATPMPAPAPAPTPAPKVEQPITNADYLQNPPPDYPRASQRLHEEGTTVVRVLIGPDGRAQEVHTARSSGFVRLDKAAEQTALAWRYVPGKRGGVPEAMWVDVPIKWALKKEETTP